MESRFTKKELAISHFAGKKRADHESRKYPLPPSIILLGAAQITRLNLMDEVGTQLYLFLWLLNLMKFSEWYFPLLLTHAILHVVDFW